MGVVWAVVALLAVGGLAFLIVRQRTHESQVVAQLRGVVGRPLTIGINLGTSRFNVLRFDAILDGVDVRTRWVTFDRLDPAVASTWPDNAEAMAATFRSDGVLADRIAWIQEENSERKDLN